MAKLKFYARADLLELVPDQALFVGNPPRYVGRAYVVVDGAASFPASKDAHECEETSAEAHVLKIRCRRDASLWPADKHTADACGVEFTPVDFQDGEWIAAPTKPALTVSASKSKE